MSNTVYLSRPSISQSTTDELSVELADSDNCYQSNNSVSVESATTTHTRRVSESETIDCLTLLLQISNVDEKLLLQNHGYRKVDTICDTLQGQLFKALILNPSDHKSGTKYVAIKKTEKHLLNDKITVQNGISFCVSEDIRKEASILRYLTQQNTPIGGYIVKYIDFFESRDDYYLVMEYIESEMNFKQFINVCKVYVQNGQLSLKEYQKIVKYLLWQLFVTIQWLHVTMQCCHLDICTDNIMIDCEQILIDTPNGMIINPNIKICLTDFGVAEIFSNHSQNHSFLCNKPCLSLVNEGYSSPKVFAGDIYDARAEDNWMLGIVLFECMTVGQTLYKPLDIHKICSGRWALKCNKLAQYLGEHDLLKYFTVNSLHVLKGLLNVNESKRLFGVHILMEPWFHMYFMRYKKQIIKKFYRRPKALDMEYFC